MKLSKLPNDSLQKMLQRAHGAYRAAELDNDGAPRPYDTMIWIRVARRIIAVLEARHVG